MRLFSLVKDPGWSTIASCELTVSQGLIKPRPETRRFSIISTSIIYVRCCRCSCLPGLDFTQQQQ